MSARPTHGDHVRTAFVTTSYPLDEHDPAGHFVRAEARRTPGHVVVMAPGPSRVGTDAIAVLGMGGGDAFGWPGVATRLQNAPWRVLGLAAWGHRVARALKLWRPDRVIAHWCVPSGSIAVTQTRASVELVSHGGDVRLLLGLPGPLRSRMVRSLVKGAQVWRFVSLPLLTDLLGALGKDDALAVERLARIEAPALELHGNRARSLVLRQGLEQRKVAVVVGRLVRSKRVDEVIRHVATGHADVLVVVGDGPEQARLERLARRLGVDARFVGKVGRDEAIAWMGAADLVLHASRAEGLSTVKREADALGTRWHWLGSS